MNCPRRWNRPAIAAGASAGETFAANLHSLLRMVQANVPGASEGRDPEYLHQLRAGLRRLRSTLRAFRPLLRRRKTDACDGALREIQHALGAARDWDVFLRSHGGSRFAQAAQRQRMLAHRRARAILRSARFRTTLRELRTWETAAPWRPGAEPDRPAAAFADRALRRLRRDLRDAAEEIDWSDAKRRHRVRIRAKRLRYGCECFAAAYPARDIRRHLKRLSRLQRILGEMNDIVVQRGLLQDLARDARSRKPAAALSASLAAREAGLAGQAARRWRRLEAARYFSNR